MNDGDKALVVQDDLFIEVAERNMKGVVPLYYEMSTAEPEIITNKEIYKSLLLAFKANIGEVSNNITKIFNSNQEIDLDVVKWLTAENNYIIDYAKTLYMPKRPAQAEERIKSAIKGKVPNFFMEAKKKDRKDVAAINRSTVNRLRKVIPNKNIKFEEITGIFDYKMLMSDDIEYVNNKIIKLYLKLDRSKQWLIRQGDFSDKKDGALFAYKYIKDELCKIEKDEDKIVNSLVKELYSNTNLMNKASLWNCFGGILLANLRENLKNTKQCESCGTRIEVDAKNNKYCMDCATEIKRIKTRERVRKYRSV